MADSDQYEPCETVWEFLQLKGSVGLLALLYERPRTYSELESEIEITSSTISRRRDDADHLDLLTVDLESNEHGTKHVYRLTNKGDFLARRMARKGIISSYHKMRDHQKTIEEKTEEVVDWVEQNPEQLVHFLDGKEKRAAPREDTELPPELAEIRSNTEVPGEETESPEEESGQGNDNDADDKSDESVDRQRPPSESLPDDLHESDDDKVQDMLGDMGGETGDTAKEDDDTGS